MQYGDDVGSMARGVRNLISTQAARVSARLRRRRRERGLRGRRAGARAPARRRRGAGLRAPRAARARRAPRAPRRPRGAARPAAGARLAAPGAAVRVRGGRQRRLVLARGGRRRRRRGLARVQRRDARPPLRHAQPGGLPPVEGADRREVRDGRRGRGPGPAAAVLGERAVRRGGVARAGARGGGRRRGICRHRGRAAARPRRARVALLRAGPSVRSQQQK